MTQDKEKSAPSAATPESGKEQNTGLSISDLFKDVKPTIMCGHFETDPDGNAYFEGASVGAIVGEKIMHSGYACVEIKVLRCENV